MTLDTGLRVANHQRLQLISDIRYLQQRDPRVVLDVSLRINLSLNFRLITAAKVVIVHVYNNHKVRTRHA